MQYEVAGDNFYVKASNLVHEGWKVHTCVCRENDDTLQIPQRVMFIPEKSLRSPFSGKWISYILWLHLETHEVLRMNREDLVINQGGQVGFVVG